MLEGLVDAVAASAWVYPVIGGVAALDALVPLVPSEATVIVAAALAGAGDLVLAFVVLAGAGGAALGDNAAYLVGRAGRARRPGRWLDPPRWGPRLRRAETTLQERAATIIVCSRFVPGGRTAAMLSAGLIGLPWRRFVGFDLAAAALWACYASALGWLGGRAFAERPVHALLLALAVASALALLLEAGRRVLRGRRVRSTSAEP